MAKRHLIPVVSGALALALFGGLGVASALNTDNITLTVDGAERSLAVRDDTVGQVLHTAGVELSDHDVVQPSTETAVIDGMEINVLYAKRLELTVDGEKIVRWTTANKVADALAMLDLNNPANQVSTSRSARIGREGLSIDVETAKVFSVTAAGKTEKVTMAGTVADALARQGISPDADDLVTPGMATELAEGMKVVFTKVDAKTTTKTVPVAFEKTTKKTASLPAGEKKVETAGVAGSAVETYAEVYHDGKLNSQKLLKRDVTKQPVAEVTLVGTKQAAASKSSGSGSSESLTPASGSTCKASYYWQGQMTATGERFNPNDLTAAHKTLPFGSKVKVTNKSNGQTVVVRINDRGPYIAGRCLDLSKAAMAQIGGTSAGVITVAYEVL